MAVLALSFLAAAAVPAQYAAIAFSVASAIGGALFGPKPQDSHLSAPKLNSLQFPSVPYGNFIPYMDGTDRLSPDVLWFSDIRATAHTQTQESGGKGGGGATSSYTDYTYDVDLLFALSHHGDGDVPVGIAKIWWNGKLIYNISSDANENTLRASHYSGAWSRLTFYDGNATQLPDPDYEAAVGDAPAYRGLSTVFIKNFQLGKSDQLGNFQFELVRRALDEAANRNYSTFTGGINDVTQHWLDTDTGNLWCAYSNTNDGREAVRLSVYNKTSGLIATHNIPDLEISKESVIGNSFGGIAKFDGKVHVFYENRDGAGTSERMMVFGEDGTYYGNHTIDLPFILSDGLGNITTGSISHAYAGEDNAGYFFRINDTTLVKIFFGHPTNDDFSYETPSDWSTFGSFRELYICGNYLVVLRFNYIADNIWVFDKETMSVLYKHTFNNFAEDCSVYDAARNKFLIADENTTSICSIDLATGVKTVTLLSMPIDADGGLVYSGPNLVNNIEGVAYDSVMDKYVLTTGYYGDYLCVLVVEPDTLVCEKQLKYPIAPAIPSLIHNARFFAHDGDVIMSSYDTYIRLKYVVKHITPDPPTVQDVVYDICQYCGLSAGQIDTTALSSITKLVHGFHSTDATSGRAMLEQLMLSHNFGACRADKIYFVPLASSPVRTFDYDELGAGLDKAEDNPFALQQNTDIERGSRYSITYPCLSNAYNTDTRSTDRRVTAVNNTIDSRDLAVVMTPEQAQGVADTLSLSTQAGRYSASVTVFGEHDDITPLDVLTFTDNAGRAHRMRAMSVTHSWPIVKMSLVMDDANAIRETGITDDSFVLDENLTPPANTVLELLDIPLISDVYETSGIGYGIAAYGDTSNWGGCAVLQSYNDTTYSQISTIGEVAAIGVATTELQAGVNDGALDISSSITFSINKAVTGSTYDDILDSATTGLWLFGSELCQVINLELVSTGVYKAHGMLRGRFGTEWAMSEHSVGERVVKIQESGLRFNDMPVGRLGQTMYYKGVTFTQSAGDVTPEIFINNGECKKPLSPVHPYATKSGNDIVLTWQRRTRLEHRLIGGLYLPLGEDSESYSIDIYDGVNVVRTITTTSPTLTYTEAQQTADFGGIQNSVHVKIYQLSAMVGRGRPLDYQSGVL